MTPLLSRSLIGPGRRVLRESRRIVVVDIDAAAVLAAPPDQAWPVIADLGTYADWLGIVRRSSVAAAHADDAGPAWDVELGAKVGPFWRTKRVRMVRVRVDERSSVRFERVEHDGRSHSSWVLEAELSPDVGDRSGRGGARLAMHLHYGGARWLPLVDVVLRDEIRKAGPRLDAYLRTVGT